MSQSNKKGNLNIVTYKKSYVEFGEGIKELCNINPKIRHIFEVKEDSTVICSTPKMAYRRIAKLMEENLPNPETRENTLWEFKVSASNVHVKTNQFLSFGWKFKPVPTKEGLSVTFFVTLFGKSYKEAEDLIKHDFEEMK